MTEGQKKPKQPEELAHIPIGSCFSFDDCFVELVKTENGEVGFVKHEHSNKTLQSPEQNIALVENDMMGMRVHLVSKTMDIKPLTELAVNTIRDSLLKTPTRIPLGIG